MSAHHGTADRPAPATAPLQAPGGGFAMLALDQRESLRRMFPAVDGREASDEQLRRFKATATRVLAPRASAVLLDRPFAVTGARPEAVGAARLILAADVLDQPPGEPVAGSHLDPLVTPEFVARVGAVAVKFLVVWRPDGRVGVRARLVTSVLDLARSAGVASLVEGVVRPPAGRDWAGTGERHAAILRAAQEISTLGGSIYKAEVPGYAPGDVSRVREQAQRMSEIVPGPWVVLSNGVAPVDFPDALREACRGGARGVLAGRAIWGDAVGDADTLDALTRRSAPRLDALSAIVAQEIVAQESAARPQAGVEGAGR